jgi:hypothetical protein
LPSFSCQSKLNQGSLAKLEGIPWIKTTLADILFFSQKQIRDSRSTGSGKYSFNSQRCFVRGKKARWGASLLGFSGEVRKTSEELFLAFL